MFFNIVATFAEFEADFIRMRTREGMAIARDRVELRSKQPNRPTDSSGTLPHACQERVFHQRSRRALIRIETNRLSHTQPASFLLAYDPAPYRNRPVQATEVSTMKAQEETPLHLNWWRIMTIKVVALLHVALILIAFLVILDVWSFLSVRIAGLLGVIALGSARSILHCVSKRDVQSLLQDILETRARVCI